MKTFILFRNAAKVVWLSTMLLVSAHSAAAEWQVVSAGQYANGTLTALVSAPGTPSERWRFLAETPSGGRVEIDYDVATGGVSYSDSEWSGAFLASGSGWVAGQWGEFSGVFAGTHGMLHDPAPPGSDWPPAHLRGNAPNGAFFRREKAQAELHALLRELASSEAPQTYVGCVGAVAATVGGTLLGSQQVSTQVRARRMGMVSAGRVATAVGGLGLVVVGGAAVSAAVCLPELVR